MGAAVVSLQEWQGWGTNSPIPAMVTQIVDDLKVLEKDFDAQLNFGGSGGKLQVSEFSSYPLMLIVILFRLYCDSIEFF